MNQKLLQNRLLALSFPKLSVFILLFSLFGSNLGFAKNQPNTFKTVDITVKGKVSDAETGDGLPGVSVSAKGSTRGAVTDVNGEYSIAVSDGIAVLVFSYVGYTPQEITVGGQTQINIQLKSDSKTRSGSCGLRYSQENRHHGCGKVSQK
jgi:hypothetical protein